MLCFPLFARRAMINITYDIIGKFKGSAFRALCLSVFFIIQSLMLSHAVEYNDEPHQHDGVVCEVTLIAADVEAVSPPPVIIDVPERFVSVPVYAVPQAPDYLRPDGRAPPGRSPPTH